MLKALAGNPPHIHGRVLFVVCAYGAAPALSFSARLTSLGLIGRIADRLTALSLRQFIAGNRDFAANVRSFEYQVGLVKDAMALGPIAKATSFIDPAFAGQVREGRFDVLGKVEIRDPSSISATDLQGFDMVILIYPDALGLGRADLEAGLLRKSRIPMLFVNGRRRIMCLDASARRALTWRRFLAHSRLVELCLSLLIVPLAAFWAARDALRGRS